MYTNDFVWTTVKNWADLGLTHHPEIEKLIETDRVLDTYLRTPAAELPSLLDPETVVAGIEARAEINALRSGLDSPMSKAVAGARNVIENTGIRVARENLDHYTAQLTERFEEAATTYRASAELVPVDFCGDDLAACTTEQFNAYRSLAESSAVLLQIRSFLTTTRILSPSANSTNYAIDFLIMDPGSPELYAEIQFAEPQNNTDRLRAAVNPILLRAVKAGAELRIATPEERDQMCAQYSADLDRIADQIAAEVRGSVGTLS